MDLSDAFGAARHALRRDPVGVLPYFLAGSGVAILGQGVFFVGALLAYAVLAAQGRIAPFLAEVRGLDIDLTTTDPDPAVVDRLGEATMTLVTPGTVLVGVGTVLVATVVVFVARAAVIAAQIHAVTGALTGSSPLEAGLAGVRRDGWRFVRLGLLAVVLYLVPVLVGVGVVAGVAVLSSAVAALLGVLLALLAVPVLFAVYLALLFVPQAIVVDDVGVLRGVRANLGFLRSNPWSVAGFVLVSIGVGGVAGFAFVALAIAGVPQLSSVVTLFAITPFLALLKTGLYLDDEAAVTPPPTGFVREGMRAAARRGRAELGAVLRHHPGLVGAGLALFGVGGVAGYRATTALSLPTIPGPLRPEDVFGFVPVDVFVQIAVNNWLVAIAQAYGGLAAGIPTAVNLLFNGFVVGAVGGLGFEPRTFAALVAPHGVIEIPALAVAGAIGLSLGRDAWRYARGRTDAPAMADSVERAFYALLGLLPVFVVAAFVEAFVTPWVATVLLG
ncbi:stage II sporulation protein M [Halobacteriaceae archaeon GCM10025711]